MKKSVFILSVLTAVLVLGLLVNLADAQITGEGSEININVNQGSAEMDCNKTSTTAFWYNLTTGAKIEDITDTSGNCSKFATAGCCPSSKPYCWTDGRCHVEGKYCSNYDTAASCNGASGDADLFGVGRSYAFLDSSICGPRESFYSSDILCTNITFCGCIWQNNECEEIANFTSVCDDGTPGGKKTSYESCSWSSVVIQDNCNTSLNNIIVTSKANFTGSLTSQTLLRKSCVDVPGTFECVSTEKLPFFGFFNFAISLISILGIYFIINKRMIV